MTDAQLEAPQVQVPLIFELSKPGRRAFSLPALDVPDKPIEQWIPQAALATATPPLPEVDELQLVRHFTRLSKRNIGVDQCFYPLGSCTMKYNPKIHEKFVNLPGVAALHPYQPEKTVQGMLAAMYSLQEYLQEIAGLDAVSLLPSAGAHGELTALMVIKAYHRHRGRHPAIVLIPDSAHGTNPASSTICGYQAVKIRSDSSGNLDLADLEAHLSDNVAALMITNPTTLGLFESNIRLIAEKVHRLGALLYMDGANMNALLGIARPGNFGVDVMHFNVHKTFSVPHGGGGPGGGPIAVKAFLADFLPVPTFARSDKGAFFLNYDIPHTIGRTRAFHGSIGAMIRSFAYIRRLGPEGLKRVSQMAVLNANYLAHHLKAMYPLAFDRICMHECVLSATEQKKKGVRALDVAKRLLDLGFHPPTIYFPLIVPEAIMIEPTETESRETLDSFIEAMKQINTETNEEAWKVQEAPFHLPVTRLDEVRAAREPVVRWKP